MGRVVHLIRGHSNAWAKVDGGGRLRPLGVEAVDVYAQTRCPFQSAVRADVGDDWNAAGHHKGTAVGQSFAVRDHINGARPWISGRRDGQIHRGAGGAVDGHGVDGQVRARAGDIEPGKALRPVGRLASDVEDYFLALVAGVGRNLTDNRRTLNDGEDVIGDNLAAGSAGRSRRATCVSNTFDIDAHRRLIRARDSRRGYSDQPSARVRERIDVDLRIHFRRTDVNGPCTSEGSRRLGW